MTPEHRKNIAGIARIFFPLEQVRYIFEICGNKDALPDNGRYVEFPLGEISRISLSDNLDLSSYLADHRLPGIDILHISDPDDVEDALMSLGNKLRNVRLIHTPIGRAFHDRRSKALLARWFRFFAWAKADDNCYAVYVNKDIAPRYLGIVRKRLKRYLGK